MQSKRSETKASGIEQLDKANELSNNVLKAFEEWIKDNEKVKAFSDYLVQIEKVKAFSDYLVQIGKPGSVPFSEFTCYNKGFNPIKRWIKKEFGKDSK
jgi:hypothetical protein